MRAADELSDVDLVEQMQSNPCYRDKREPKACDCCGYVRTVRVSFIEQYGKERDHRWARYCRACEADRRAKFYARESHRFARRAAELHEQQSKSVQRRALGVRR